MSLRYLLFAALCTLSIHTTSARADDVRYRCTGPKTGAVRVVEDDGACRGFTTGAAQTMFARMTSGTLLASKDGKTVVLIEDYLSGVVDTARKAIVTDIDSEEIVNPTVVQIWRDGKRVGFFDIARLSKDITKVEQSISHVRWVATLPANLDGPKFTLVTTSGRSITFDTRTGNIVAESDVPAPKRP